MPFQEELASQPRCWKDAAALAAGSELLLPHFGEHVAVVGSGASHHAAVAYAWLRQEAGHGPTEAFASSEVPPFRTFDRAIVLTHSGEDAWTVERLHTLREQAIVTTVITARSGSTAADLAGHLIELDFASEAQEGARFATSVMALIRAHLGEDLADVIAQAGAVVHAKAASDGAAFAGHLFLAQGWALGPANAAAATFRRLGLTADACPASEWHEMAAVPVRAGTLVWLFGSPDDLIADELAAAGATIRAATRDPMVELVSAQMWAVRGAGA